MIARGWPSDDGKPRLHDGHGRVHDVDADDVVSVVAIREAFPPLEKADGLDGFRESVWSDDPQGVLAVVRGVIACG